jgi:hypothetical protein
MSRQTVKFGRWLQGLGLALLIAAGVVLTTGGASFAAVTATVTPNSGLHDLDTVHVQASGLPASTTIAVLECARGATSSAQCEGQTLDIQHQSNASGSYDNPSYQVFVLPDAIFTTGNVSITCDATHHCDLFVGVDQNDFNQPHTLVPIEFADAAPSPSPTPTPTHSPSPTPTPTHSPSASPTPTSSSTGTPTPTPTSTGGGTTGGGTTTGGSTTGEGTTGDSTTTVAGETLTGLPRTGAPTGAWLLAAAGLFAMIAGSVSRRMALRPGNR